VAGRLIGSILEAAGSLIFAALSIWTGGDALAGAIERFAGATDGDWARPVSYAVIAAVVTAVSVLGHGSMVLVQRVMIPTAGVCMVVGLFVYAGDFSVSFTGTGQYMLGSPAAAWCVSMILCASTIASYGPYTGDWTRHISPSRHGDKAIMRTLFLGALFGLGGPFIWGAYIAVCLSRSGSADPSATFVLDLAHGCPLWFLPAVVFLGLGSGTAQAVINTYGTGLDTSSIIPRLSRPKATFVACLMATALVYAGHYYTALVTWMSTLLTLLANLAIPWIVILCIGHFAVKGRYDVEDLQVFNRGEKGGAYWFWHGFDVATTSIWLLAAVIGLLFSNNAWYTGPGAQMLNGIDVGFLVAAAVTGALYWGLTRRRAVGSTRVPAESPAAR
jgi:purine-cytosine permease-like protein